jgi:ferredoxin
LIFLLGRLRIDNDGAGGIIPPIRGLRPVRKENSMADPDDKLEDNVPGQWYVDSSCIDCDVCRTTAPNNFAANEDEGYSYVCKQPENDEEVEQMQEAAESCPVESIGDDGE